MHQKWTKIFFYFSPEDILFQNNTLLGSSPAQTNFSLSEIWSKMGFFNWYIFFSLFIRSVHDIETLKSLKFNNAMKWNYFWSRISKETFISHTDLHSFYKWTKLKSLQITIFGFKMMLKSGLRRLFWNSTCPLKRKLLTCQAKSASLGRFFSLGSSNSEGAYGI